MRSCVAQAQETQWERLCAQEKQGAAARGAEPAQSLPCARRAAALAVAHRSACDTHLRGARGQRLLLTGILSIRGSKTDFPKLGVSHLKPLSCFLAHQNML